MLTSSVRCSVVAMETRQYAIGDTITMQLMRREKGVLVALPKSQWMNVVQPVYIRGECISVLVVGIPFLTVTRIGVETVDPGCKTWGLAAEKLDDHILTVNLYTHCFSIKAVTCVLCPFK